MCCDELAEPLHIGGIQCEQYTFLHLIAFVGCDIMSSKGELEWVIMS